MRKANEVELCSRGGRGMLGLPSKSCCVARNIRFGTGSPKPYVRAPRLFMLPVMAYGGLHCIAGLFAHVLLSALPCLDILQWYYSLYLPVCFVLLQSLLRRSCRMTSVSHPRIKGVRKCDLRKGGFLDGT